MNIIVSSRHFDKSTNVDKKRGSMKLFKNNHFASQIQCKSCFNISDCSTDAWSCIYMCVWHMRLLSLKFEGDRQRICLRNYLSALLVAIEIALGKHAKNGQCQFPYTSWVSHNINAEKYLGTHKLIGIFMVKLRTNS